MGLFDKIKEPIFLKENSAATKQLEELQSLLETTDVKAMIEQDIKALTYGILGENNIAFELRNSHIPMFILRDLYLVHGDLSAQIDYLIITRYHNFVIECKNLFGNIEINDNGDFIRTIFYNGKYKKEGIYSPITQNTRHIELIKQIRGETKSNILIKALFEKSFYNNYRSVVVLANPKTVLNDKYAKKEVKQQVIRADQLVDFIKKTDSEKGSEALSEQQMQQLAQFFLSIHQENPIDYTEKYRNLVELVSNEIQLPQIEEIIPQTTETQNPIEPIQSEVDTITCPKCGSSMVKRKATKGANEGNEFYGCSKFPKCRAIVANVPTECTI